MLGAQHGGAPACCAKEPQKFGALGQVCRLTCKPLPPASPRAQALKSAGAQDPFTAMVGLAFIMVAIAGEIGWHVTQVRSAQSARSLGASRDNYHRLLAGLQQCGWPAGWAIQPDAAACQQLLADDGRVLVPACLQEWFYAEDYR